jgi:hypothetical protein
MYLIPSGLSGGDRRIHLSRKNLPPAVLESAAYVTAMLRARAPLADSEDSMANVGLILCNVCGKIFCFVT